MKKQIVKKVYLALDHIFLSKKDVERMIQLADMEHKEMITERYALIHDNDDFMSQYEWFDYETKTDFVGVDRDNVLCQFFKEKIHALQELKELEG